MTFYAPVYICHHLFKTKGFSIDTEKQLFLRTISVATETTIVDSGPLRQGIHDFK